MKRLDWRLIGILGLGVGLRCIFISTRSIQYDDAFSFFLARQDLTAIIHGTAADTMPPLYYFLLHFWMRISESIGWLRLLSVALDMGAVWLLFLLVKQVFNPSAGLWAAFFASISPLQIYHAQDLRMYALLAFMQMGYLFFFYKWWVQSQADLRAWKNGLALVLFGAAAMYTHNLAIFMLAVPDVFLLLKRQWRALRNLILLQVVIGLLAAPWLMMIPGQVEKIQRAFWTPLPGAVEIIQAVIVMTTNLPLEGAWLVVGAVISLQVMLLVVIEVVRHRPLRDLYLILAFFIPPTALFITSYLMRPVFVPRGFITSTLIYLGIAGAVVGLTPKIVLKGLISGGLVVAAVIGLPYQLTFTQFPRSPFEQAVHFLENAVPQGEKIIHDNKLSFFPAHYFSPGLNQSFIADEAGSPNDTYALASQTAIGLIPEKDLQTAVGNAETITFVVFQTTIDEYRALGLADHPSLIILQNRYQNIQLERVGDLNIYRFNGLK